MNTFGLWEMSTQISIRCISLSESGADWHRISMCVRLTARAPGNWLNATSSSSPGKPFVLRTHTVLPQSCQAKSERKYLCRFSYFHWRVHGNVIREYWWVLNEWQNYVSKDINYIIFFLSWFSEFPLYLIVKTNDPFHLYRRFTLSWQNFGQITRSHVSNYTDIYRNCVVKYI